MSVESRKKKRKKRRKINPKSKHTYTDTEGEKGDAGQPTTQQWSKERFAFELEQYKNSNRRANWRAFLEKYMNCLPDGKGKPWTADRLRHTHKNNARYKRARERREAQTPEKRKKGQSQGKRKRKREE